MFSSGLRRTAKGAVEVDMTYECSDYDEASSTTTGSSAGFLDATSTSTSPDVATRECRWDFSEQDSEDSIDRMSSQTSISSAGHAARRVELERLISSLPPTSSSNEENNLQFAGLGSKLQQALFEALAVGLNSDDEIVAQARRIVNSWEDARAVARAQLSKYVDEFQNCGLKQINYEALKSNKKRLSNALLTARDLNLAESEVKDVEVYRRRTHNRIEDIKGQVRVFCRIRPVNETEKRNKDQVVTHAIDDMTVLANDRASYNFDCVFAPGTQSEVFQDCNDLVQSAFDGFNVTILMYGQTGAGKTYTMHGDQSNEGISGHAIAEIFRLAKECETHQQTRVSTSVLELYNNSLTDLAALASDSMSVRSTGDVSGLREIPVDNEVELKAVLATSLERRAIASHALNSESSRSHFLFVINISGVNHETGQQTHGKIVLCDLAGSERLKKTEASGARRKEAIEINKSLTALGDVIEAVAKKQKQIPYRNHKLTQILQDSIGGSAKTLMIVNCAPTLSNASETTMALKFASRAKKITNASETSRQSRA